MSKEFIQKLVRENLTEKENKTEEGNNTDSYESDYKEIQNKLEGGVLKAAQIMQKTGMGKASDATARSLFSKKIRREKNSDGSEYKFSPEDINKIKQVLNNPNTF